MKLGIAVNTEIIGISQYGDFNFDSLAVVNGKLVGGGTTGIFEISGDNDNGAAIRSLIKTALTDFGNPDGKRVILARIVGDLKGSLSVLPVLDGDVDDAITSNVASSVVDQIVEVATFNSTRTGVEVGLQIENINGADFSIDKIDIKVVKALIEKEEGRISLRLKATAPMMEIDCSVT